MVSKSTDVGVSSGVRNDHASGWNAESSPDGRRSVGSSGVIESAGSGEVDDKAESTVS